MYVTKLAKNASFETVSESQMTAQCLLALVKATFMRLLSDKKPTSPLSLDLTILIMIASFSRPVETDLVIGLKHTHDQSWQDTAISKTSRSHEQNAPVDALHNQKGMSEDMLHVHNSPTLFAML